MMKAIVWFIVSSTVSTVILGLTDFSCDTTTPLKGSDVTCKCVSPNNIEWQLNDATLSTCITSGICSPQPAGYGFTTDISNSDKIYNLTVQGYDYNSCTVYSCTDLNTTEEQKVTLSIAAFDSTSPSVFVEPGNKQDGKIEITTECLFKESDIMVEWYYVKDNVTEVPYTPSAPFKTSTNCADTCNGEAAVRLNIGFTHTEEKSDSKQIVKFGLKVYHKEDTTNALDLKTGSEYNIKASTEDKTSDTDAIVGGTVGGVLGLCCLAAAVVGIRHLKKKGRTTTLTFVEGSKVTFSCPFPESVTFPEWRGPPGLTIYTNLDDTSETINSKIPAFNRLQYARNKRDLILSNAVVGDSGDYKCSYTGQGDHTFTLKVIRGKGDKASNVVNTGSHPDEKKKQRRPQPPPPFGANSPQREGSGSVVSRKDVEMQETYTPLKRREGSGSVVTGRDVEMQETYTPLKRSQSPDIHDGKRRGLSANFTDGHHPLVSIDIPAKRAGALESIPDSAREDVTKKKKKRKRRVETEDDQSD